jgi:hypothetical protein
MAHTEQKQACAGQTPARLQALVLAVAAVLVELERAHQTDRSRVLARVV